LSCYSVSHFVRSFSMSCAQGSLSPKAQSHDVDIPQEVPPPWLLRHASPSPNTHVDCKADFEVSNVPRGPCEAKPDFGLCNVAGSPCKARPTSEHYVGQEVYVLRTGGSWSPGILAHIQEDFVTVTLNEGGEKQIPIDLMHAQIKLMQTRERSVSPQPTATSDKWSVRLPVKVLRTNGSWSHGMIVHLQKDFMTVGLSEGGEKRIPAHLMDTQVVPIEPSNASKERFGFNISDVVRWTAADEDIPTGSTGVIRGFKDAFVTVQFPKGTWDLLPCGLLKVGNTKSPNVV